MGMLIGLFTSADDPHLAHLIPVLKKRGLPFIRFDRADFPQQIQLAARCESSSGWRGTVCMGHTRYALSDLHSILYRRPTSYRFVEGLSTDEQEFARLEASKGFEGVLLSLPCRWLNHPDALRAAEWKPQQLRLAQEVGWRVPRTLITNNPQEVQHFFEECHGEIIYKTVSFPPTVPDREQPERFATIFTTKVMLAHLQTYAGTITQTAHLFQEYIPKALELRINVIGERIFTTAIDSQRSERTRVDWRRSYADLRYSTYTLPDEIQNACRRLLARLQVSFAALDVIVTPGGEFVFLEANCNGQWGWIETAPGQPLSEAFVEVLAEGRAA